MTISDVNDRWDVYIGGSGVEKYSLRETQPDKILE